MKTRFFKFLVVALVLLLVGFAGGYSARQCYTARQNSPARQQLNEPEKTHVAAVQGAAVRGSMVYPAMQLLQEYRNRMKDADLAKGPYAIERRLVAYWTYRQLLCAYWPLNYAEMDFFFVQNGFGVRRTYQRLEDFIDRTRLGEFMFAEPVSWNRQQQLAQILNISLEARAGNSRSFPAVRRC